MFDVVVAVVLWLTWRFRNNAIFGTVKLRKDELFDDIRFFLTFEFLIEIGKSCLRIVGWYHLIC